VKIFNLEKYLYFIPVVTKKTLILEKKQGSFVVVRIKLSCSGVILKEKF
jgi:hypothetical protein